MTKKFSFPIFIVLYEISTYLSNDMYLPALPFVKENFDITESLVLLSLTFWFIGSFSIQFLTGPFSDRYGRKPILILGCLLFISANLLAAHTEIYILFLIARCMQGASVCCVVVAGYASIHEFFDDKEAIKTISLMNSFMILAPAFGPLLGAWMITRFHWTFMFDLLAMLTLIAFFGFCFYMPETNQHKTTHLNFKEMCLDYFDILRNRTFLAISLSFCLIFAGLISWITASPFFIMVTLHKSPISFGFIQLIVFGGFVVGTRMASFYASNKDISTKIIQRGLSSIIIAAVICLFAAYVRHYSFEIYVLGMTFYAFCTGMVFSPMQRQAVFTAGPKMGCNMAMFFTIMSLMCVVGSITINLFYNGLMLSMAIILTVFALLSCLAHLCRRCSSY